MPSGIKGSGSKKGRVTTKFELSGDLKQKIDKFPEEFDKTVGTYLDYQAGKVQDYMRSNAKWTDRTGNARQGLFAKYGKTKNGHVIVIYGTVPYQIFLETRWDGKFAIIEPTLTHYGPQLMRGTSGLIASMK